MLPLRCALWSAHFFLRPILIAEIELNELLYLLVRVEGEIESFTMRFELDDSFRKKASRKKKIQN